MIDKLGHVKAQIGANSGRFKPKEEHDGVKICCPFHGGGNERTPSCKVFTTGNIGRFYCFEGNTRIITETGTFPIKKLVGKTVPVLTTGGIWVKAPISYFGKQEIYELHLKRNGITKVIETTAEHEWLVRDRTGYKIKKRIQTQNLKGNHVLETVIPVNITDKLIPDEEGIRHGFIFGDGTLNKRDKTSTAYLYHHKREFMLPYFDGYRKYTYEKNKQIVATGFPPEYKLLPSIKESKEYLYGFIIGLLASDGSVSKSGAVMVNNTSDEVLNKVRNICTKLGLVTHPVSVQLRKGYNSIETPIYRLWISNNLTAAALINPGHRKRFESFKRVYSRLKWRVEKIVRTRTFKKVYCATVMGTHAFALEDFILTGNCYACHEKGDWNILCEATGMTGFKRSDQVHDVFTFVMPEINYSEVPPNLEDVRDLNKYSIKTPWRGIELDTLKLFDARFPKHPFYNQDDFFYLPVYVNKKYVGGIYARRVVTPEGKARGEISYINTKGQWSKRNVFGYDIAKKRKGPLWYVEGPRDCLKIAQLGGRVVAGLGSYVGPHKIRLIENLDPPALIIGTDPDEAGEKARDYIKKNLPMIPIVEAEFPDGKDPACFTAKSYNRMMKTLGFGKYVFSEAA